MNFKEIRTVNGSQDEGFEEFCCQLARIFKEIPEGSHFQRFQGSGGDGGVECVWSLQSGEEWGWQAKYFFQLDKKQITKSFITALDVHPNLTRYYICVPFNLTGPTKRKGKSQQEKFNDYVKEWKEYANSKGIDIDIISWDSSELLTEVLKQEFPNRIINFWLSNKLLEKKWFQQHIENAKNQAGPRYTPLLNVKTPIYQIFEAFGETDIWHAELDDYIYHLTEKRDYWKIITENGGDTQSPKFDENIILKLNSFIGDLGEIIVFIKSMKTREIHTTEEVLSNKFENLSDHGRNLVEYFKHDLEEKHGLESVESVNFRQFQAEYMVSFPAQYYDNSKETLDLISNLKNALLEGNLCFPFVSELLITGIAGAGKTHAFCDIASNRLARGLYSVILFGEQFVDMDIWEQIRIQLNVPNQYTIDDLLFFFDVIGNVSQYPLIIFIDALNESRPRSIWERNLNSIIGKIKTYRNIKLCFSCRTCYRDVVIPLDTQIKEISHKGFEGVEYEACYSFFQFYGIESPSFPLLQPEFSNPLFLKLFCQSLVDSGIKHLSDRMYSFSEIISNFINSKEIKISKILDYNPRERKVHKAIEGFLTKISTQKVSYIEWFEAKTICDEIWSLPKRSESLFDQLLGEEIIKENRILLPDQTNPINVIEFSFEKVKDYLIADEYLNHINSDMIDDAFIEGGGLYHITKDENSVLENVGLIEAMGLLIPEKYRKELFDLIPNIDNILRKIIIKSMYWRSRESFTQKTLENIEFLRKNGFFKEIFDLLLTLSLHREHPLNILYLHEILKIDKLPIRDSYFCPYMFFSYEKKEVVSHIINHTNDRMENLSLPSITLWATVLLWFCSAADREIRDKATKGIITIIHDKWEVWPQLIILFSNIDDEYITERLLACIYGTLIRSTQIESPSELIKILYDVYLKNRQIPPNVQIRNYIRLIFEFLKKNDLLNDEIRSDLYSPPYSSSQLVIPTINPVQNESYPKESVKNINGSDCFA